MLITLYTQQHTKNIVLLNYLVTFVTFMLARRGPTKRRTLYIGIEDIGPNIIGSFTTNVKVITVTEWLH